MLIDIISFERNSFIMRKFSKENFFYRKFLILINSLKFIILAYLLEIIILINF